MSPSGKTRILWLAVMLAGSASTALAQVDEPKTQTKVDSAAGMSNSDSEGHKQEAAPMAMASRHRPTEAFFAKKSRCRRHSSSCSRTSRSCSGSS